MPLVPGSARAVLQGEAQLACMTVEAPETGSWGMDGCRPYLYGVPDVPDLQPAPVNLARL